MTGKLKKEITALSSAKNDLKTGTKSEENKNSIQPLGRLEYIYKFPDPNGHENHHLDEAVTISEPLDERIVQFLKTQIRSGCKRIKELQMKTSIFVKMKKARILEEDIQTKQQKNEKFCYFCKKQNKVSF